MSLLDDQPPFSPLRSAPKAALKLSRQKQIPSSDYGLDINKILYTYSKLCGNPIPAIPVGHGPACRLVSLFRPSVIFENNLPSLPPPRQHYAEAEEGEEGARGFGDKRHPLPRISRRAR